MVVTYSLEREAPEAGYSWFSPTFEEDLGCFIQGVHRMIIIDDLTDTVAEGTKSYQVVL